jgi:GDP-L-fucose synthase
MCCSYNRQYGTQFVPVMPTNLYGPNDNFDLENSHVLPALMRKFHEAKEAGKDLVAIWGTGKPKREFLHVDDMADACVFLMRSPLKGNGLLFNSSKPLINIGAGKDVTISGLAEIIRDVTGFKGGMSFDDSKPDGIPRKLLDCSLLSELGWTAKISLSDGVESTYRWFFEKGTC